MRKKRHSIVDLLAIILISLLLLFINVLLIWISGQAMAEWYGAAI